MLLRGDVSAIHFPHQTNTRVLHKNELGEVEKYIREFCTLFDYDADEMLQETYTEVTPNSKNPYKQMYVAN